MRATEPDAAAVPEARAPAADRRRLPWRVAEILEVRPETARASTLVLRVPGWPGHRPGQHVDVRLTAEDGYQAQRSYSIASPPEAGHPALTVDRIEDGEVSPYLTGEVRAGDRFELRGPVGGYFAWTAAEGGPLFLVSGGSGVVPLMAMLRHRRRTMPELAMRLVYSVRNAEDVIYADELGDDAVLTFTREPPEGWSGHTGRIDSSLVAAAGVGSGTAFICGSHGFVETAAGLAMDAGFDPRRIRTERFGPSGA
jgi:ferredoxin-NADP reductase